MGNNKKIELTQAEIDEIKDTAGFRAKVILELKILRGVPRKVGKLEVFSYVQWLLITFILGLMAWGANGIK